MSQQQYTVRFGSEEEAEAVRVLAAIDGLAVSQLLADLAVREVRTRFPEIVNRVGALATALDVEIPL